MTTRPYTFLIPITFDVQFTFESDDVELVPIAHGGLPEYRPSDSAIESLRNEFTEYIGEHYAINSVQIQKPLMTFLGSDDDISRK